VRRSEYARRVKQVLLVAVVLVSCDGKKDGQPAAAAGPVPSNIDAAPPAVVDAAPVDALLAHLPALEVRDVARAAVEQSVALNTAGYAAHRKKDWPTAIARYTEAVLADPGNLVARYNLACVYVSSGEVDEGFELLAQFDRPDCRACAATLLHAKRDGEWKPVAADPRFTALVGDVTVAPVKLKEVAQQVIAALRSGKPDGLEPYVHPRGPVKVSTLVYGPDQDPPVLHHGWSGFVELVGKGDKDLEDSRIVECDKRCCRTGSRGDSSYVVDEICFTDRGGVPFLASIQLDPGSI
jgi:hypothetical protein